MQGLTYSKIWCFREEKLITVWGWLAVGIGGGFGAVARFLVVRYMEPLLGDYLPYGTLTVNVLGSWLLGFSSIFLFDHLEISSVLRLGLTVGFLGAFTTFSAFSYESVLLLQDGAFWRASLTVATNLFLCLALCYLGMQMARW